MTGLTALVSGLGLDDRSLGGLYSLEAYRRSHSAVLSCGNKATALSTVLMSVLDDESNPLGPHRHE